MAAERSGWLRCRARWRRWRGRLPAATTSERKRAGLLDSDDLIERTRTLLVDPGAAWVLYKLDGGIEHLLLDEAQDTAPDQWGIVHALTEEFFAGAGARERSARCSRWATGSSRSIPSRAPTPAEFDAARRTGASACNVGPGSGTRAGRLVPLAPPGAGIGRCVFADPLAPSGRGRRPARP